MVEKGMLESGNTVIDFFLALVSRFHFASVHGKDF
jgi:hypothetical protein